MKANKSRLIGELTMRFPNVNPQKVAAELKQKYDIPLSISANILSAQKYLDEYSEYILYCFCDIITPNLVKTYFVDREINYYGRQKYEIKTVKFPIVFNVNPVTDQQWIGSFTMKELMEFRAAGLINYNINTQRTLAHIVKGNQDYYTVAINRINVEQIKGMVKRGEFIPNTITLNIQTDDPIADFEYKDGKLIVRSITAFDIIDGFHRYLAFGQIYDEEPDFDYPLEIRITNFGESKGKQFTYQEDQKTLMKKVDSDSLNQYNLYNMLVQRLNEDTLCDFHGLIKTGRTISEGYLAVALKIYNISDRKEMIGLVKIIRDKLNRLTMIDPNLLEMEWQPWHIYTAVWCFKNEKSPDITVKSIYKSDELDKETKTKILKASTFKDKTQKCIESIVKEVEDNV